MALEEVQGEKWYSEPLSIVVFGASGDLAKKEIYPALFDLFKDKLLGKHTLICGYARSAKTDTELRQRVRPGLEKRSSDAGLIDEFLDLCMYRSGSYDSADALKTAVDELDEVHGSRSGGVVNRIFYFAIPPSMFVAAASIVKKSGVSKSGFTRVVVEKPFGNDTNSAKLLLRDLGSLFEEKHLYRMDHYLGLEMVQNLLTFRFGNVFTEPIWNKNHVKAVFFNFDEDFGTDGRGGFYDSAGMIRDVLQNHIMQLVALVAMEPPKKLVGKGYSDAIRDAKVKALKSVSPWKLADTVLGQYTANDVRGGYVDDDTVPNDSITETYVCVKFKVNSARWKGVPFIIKAGKGLSHDRTQVRMLMRQPKGALSTGIPNNEMVLNIHRDDKIAIKTNIKTPGFDSGSMQADLALSYAENFGEEGSPEAYTRLILDILRGNQANFVRDDEVLAAWKIVTPLLDSIAKSKPTPIKYKFGSYGPKEANDLIEKEGFVLDY